MEKVYNLQKLQNKLKKYLDKERFIHTQGVMYTSAALAMVHGYDITKAQVAGLLHDCAKCIPNKKKIKMCRKHHIAISDAEMKNPFLLHAKLGAYVAKEKYFIEDDEILKTIVYHTTGRPNMGLLEKIVFVADYIEPGRCKACRLTKIREQAFKDIDLCILYILEDTLKYLARTPQDIDKTTKEAFEYYKTITENKEEVH